MTRTLKLTLSLILVLILGYVYLGENPPSNRVQALGKLVFTFNHLPPNAPVFNIADVKPGDCYSKEVTVSNETAADALIAVKADQIQNTDNFGNILTLKIQEGAAILYGGSGANTRTLNQFFATSTASLDGLSLSTVLKGHTTVYTFTVCMPREAGNEWQQKTLRFDLLFGRVSQGTCNFNLTQINTTHITNTIIINGNSGNNVITNWTNGQQTSSPCPNAPTPTPKTTPPPTPISPCQNWLFRLTHPSQCRP